MSEPYGAIIPQEKVGISPSCGSMIPLEDGRIMWVWGSSLMGTLQANYSSDGGRTWSDPVGLKQADGSGLKGLYAPGLIRLQSGKICMVQRQKVEGGNTIFAQTVVSFHVSDDDGKSWSEGVVIEPQANHLDVYFDQVIQLKDGRIVIPFAQGMGPTPNVDNPKQIHRFGRPMSGGFAYHMSFILAYYSDDEGGTWRRSSNEAHATIDRGMGGGYSMSEPCIAELADGKVMMLGRTNLGRSFRTVSSDRGETWMEAEATGMAPRRGPMGMKKLPGRDDILVIWNMISSWEAFNGLYRHRLVSSVTSDGGKTFHHHKILESLDDRCDLEPEPVEPIIAGFFDVKLDDTKLWSRTEGGTGARQPVDSARYGRAPGPLRIDHPYCTFHDGNAVIAYSVGVLGDPNIIIKTYGKDYMEVCRKYGFQINRNKLGSVKGNNKVRVIPIEWFYE